MNRYLVNYSLLIVKHHHNYHQFRIQHSKSFIRQSIDKITGRNSRDSIEILSKKKSNNRLKSVLNVWFKRNFGIHGPSSAEAIKVEGTKKIGAIHILKKMFTYVWPKDNPNIRKRVLISVGLLILSKVFSFNMDN